MPLPGRLDGPGVHRALRRRVPRGAAAARAPGGRLLGLPPRLLRPRPLRRGVRRVSLRRGLVRPGLHHQRHRPGLSGFAPQRDAQERHGPPQRHGLCAAAPSSPSFRGGARPCCAEASPRRGGQEAPRDAAEAARPGDPAAAPPEGEGQQRPHGAGEGRDAEAQLRGGLAEESGRGCRPEGGGARGEGASRAPEGRGAHQRSDLGL
mmetsp:Transcript_3978/g.11504  ORF Transcript_3978/g.11504 Transcript_3978/m.11504 type:complete len:206 (+) Transcript_3978:1594-2211(+)